MNATGYIIEPSWFYWLSVLDSLKFFLGGAIFLLIILIVVALIIIAVDTSFINDYPNSCAGEKRTVAFLTKCLKVAIPALIISSLGSIFIPNQETLITMMVAKYATYENVGLTVDALKGAVDYIIQSIQSLK